MTGQLQPMSRLSITHTAQHTSHAACVYSIVTTGQLLCYVALCYTLLGADHIRCVLGGGGGGRLKAQVVIIKKEERKRKRKKKA